MSYVFFKSKKLDFGPKFNVAIYKGHFGENTFGIFQTLCSKVEKIKPKGLDFLRAKRPTVLDKGERSEPFLTYSKGMVYNFHNADDTESHK